MNSTGSLFRPRKLVPTSVAIQNSTEVENCFRAIWGGSQSVQAHFQEGPHGVIEAADIWPRPPAIRRSESYYERGACSVYHFPLLELQIPQREAYQSILVAHRLEVLSGLTQAALTGVSLARRQIITPGPVAGERVAVAKGLQAGEEGRPVP